LSSTGLCQPKKVTASIGLAVYPSHANDLNQLLQKASSARLSAESKGGNQAEYTE
jgi:GGDEF domain-containing protein